MKRACWVWAETRTEVELVQRRVERAELEDLRLVRLVVRACVTRAFCSYTVIGFASFASPIERPLEYFLPFTGTSTISHSSFGVAFFWFIERMNTVSLSPRSQKIPHHKIMISPRSQRKLAQERISRARKALEMELAV